MMYDLMPKLNLGAVADYDVIVIAGKTYSANQVLDKQLVAARDVKLYRGNDFNTPFSTVKAGQPIGKVYSYIKATQSTGVRAGGPLLEFLDNTGRAYYVKDDNAISTQVLKDQGALTYADEIKKEQEELKKQNDPVSYYAKKILLPGVLLIGGIYLAAQLGKQFIASKATKSTSLSGFPKLIGKSDAASQVLHLMDKDYDYSQAVKISVNEHTKGFSLNKKKQFKNKLEKELNRYI